MSRIADKLKELKKRNECALIPYIMAGDPDIETTGKLVVEMERSGADMVELGVPFSDPLADGPTIQKAAIRALANKTNLKKVFALVKTIRKTTEIPIILMLYYNLVYKYGEDAFARDAAAAGVDGTIIPDLPPDEASGLLREARANRLDVIFLLAPTSSRDRVHLVDRRSRGFIYYVSLTGVTGARKTLDKGIEESVEALRLMTDKPICVGFGISRPDQAKKVAAWADGVIVGSAIVGLMEKTKSATRMLKEVGGFVSGLKEAVRKAR